MARIWPGGRAINKRPQRTRLVRSESAILWGVCGGIAEYLGWRPDGVRWAWAGITLMTGIVGGVVAYAVAALLMPAPFRLEEYRQQ